MSVNLKLILSSLKRVEYRDLASVKSLVLFNSLLKAFILSRLQNILPSERLLYSTQDLTLMRQLNHNKEELQKLEQQSEESRRITFEQIKQCLIEGASILQQRFEEASSYQRKNLDFMQN